MNLHDYAVEDLLEQMEADRGPDFWSHVDTERSYYGRHSGETWIEERGPWCLAATGRGARCAKGSGNGPFCSFHMARVREWFEAHWRHQGLWRAAMHNDLSTEQATRVIRQARNLLQSTPAGSVYFWELEGQGLVKIGTSRRVETRVAQFRTGKGCTFPPDVDPSRGRLIGTTPGGRELEAHLHNVYRRHRVIGEWFRLTDELADDIAQLIAREEAAS